MTMSAWWPKTKDERKSRKGDFDEAVRRQKAAAEKLKKSLERIRPFEEMAEVLGSAKKTP